MRSEQSKLDKRGLPQVGIGIAEEDLATQKRQTAPCEAVCPFEICWLVSEQGACANPSQGSEANHRAQRHERDRNERSSDAEDDRAGRFIA